MAIAKKLKTKHTLRHCSITGCVHHQNHAMYNSGINHHQVHQQKLLILNLFFLAIFGINPFCCGGIRSSEFRQFSNGLPWVLPIFLGHLGQTDKLNGPEEIPKRLSLLDTTYTLGGITFWNGVHCKGRLQYHGRWYDYDGMHSMPLEEINDVSAPSPVGSTIASTVYFKEFPAS